MGHVLVAFGACCEFMIEDGCESATDDDVWLPDDDEEGEDAMDNGGQRSYERLR